MDFEWVGDPISVEDSVRQLTPKPKTFYKYNLFLLAGPCAKQLNNDAILL